MSYFEQLLRVGAQQGLQMTVFPSRSGGFQGNVSEPGGRSWSTATRDDPVDALQAALTARIGRLPDRKVITEEQFDIEDAIQAAPATSEWDDLLG